MRCGVIIALLALACGAGWTNRAQADSSSSYYKFCITRSACGLVDSKGEIAIAPRFGAIAIRDQENIAVLTTSGVKREFGMVSFEDGLRVVEPQFDYIGFLGEGLINVRVNGKYGYINTKGERVIEPQFDGTSDSFKNGFAVVAIGKGDQRKYGFIDTKGEWLLKPQFEYADSFAEDNFAGVRINGKWGLIDKSGKLVFKPQFFSSGVVEGGLRTLSVGDDVVYLNSDGKYVAEQEKKLQFMSGLRSVQVDWKWGYVNAEGEMVIPPQFDFALEFNDEGFAVAGMRLDVDETYLINTKGKILLTTDTWYKAGKVGDKGFIRFEKDNKWGLADYSGNILTEPQYENMFVFDNGLLKVVKDGKYGFLDENGKEFSDFQFDRIDHFLDSGLAVAFKDGKAGLLNNKAEWVIEPQYANMFESSGIQQREKDILWAVKGGVTYYLNTRGEVLLYIDNVCDTAVARNAKGKIIYPENFSESACDQIK